MYAHTQTHVDTRVFSHVEQFLVTSLMVIFSTGTSLTTTFSTICNQNEKRDKLDWLK